MSYPWRGWSSTSERISSSALPFFHSCSTLDSIYVASTYVYALASGIFHRFLYGRPPAGFLAAPMERPATESANELQAGSGPASPVLRVGVCRWLVRDSLLH